MRRTIREEEPTKPSTRLTQELALGVPPSGGRVSEPPSCSGTSGVEPAEAGTPNQLPARATSSGGAPTPHDTKELIHLLRGDLDWIVMKCLEKDRARRYDTANGLARDIERHLNNEPVVASPPSSLYRFQKLVRRNKMAFGAGTAVAVALIVGIVIATAGWQQAMNQRNSALAARADEAIQRQQAQDAQQKADAAKALAERNSEHARRNLYAADMKAVQQYLAEGNLGAAQTLLSSYVPKEDQEDLCSWATALR